MDSQDDPGECSVYDEDCGRSSANQPRPHEVYTEEEFNNDIDLKDEWQDDDLLSLSAQRTREKLGAPAAKSDFKTFDGQVHQRHKLNFSEDIPEGSVSGAAAKVCDDVVLPGDFDHDTSASDSPQRMVGVDLEWDNDTPIIGTPNPVAHSASSESSLQCESSVYRTVVIGEEELQMDLSAVIPYKQVLSHGGYYGEGLNAIVVFSACFLPDCNQTDYDYIMDNLFLYIVSTLDLLVAEEYKIVFFNGGCKRRNVPSFTWMKRCYKMIHRRLRKNLKELLVVHPSFFMRALITFFRPFISSKFSRKLRLISSLKELSNSVDLASVSIPDAVSAHDARRYRASRRVVVARQNSENSQAPGTAGEAAGSTDDE